jgi:hypothetical protein
MPYYHDPLYRRDLVSEAEYLSNSSMSLASFVRRAQTQGVHPDVVAYLDWCRSELDRILSVLAWAADYIPEDPEKT